jgi:hypothetical protein
MDGLVPGVGLTTPDGKVRVGQEVLVGWTNSGTAPVRNALTNASGQLWAAHTEITGFDFHDLTAATKQSIAVGPRETSLIRAALPLEHLRST